MNWEPVKTSLAVWGAVTGTVGLFLQYLKHRSERPRFEMTARLSICFEPGKGKELRIHAAATNHGHRRGYVSEFNAEFSGEAPFHSMGFVPAQGEPVPVEPGEKISFELPIPLDYFPII